MAEHACTLERFLGDVRDHQLTVLIDDGVRRHLRFRKPGTSCYWFDLVTWPGVLVINGDCGTYVFARIEDMFQFFRNSKDHPDSINPSYWSEKVLAECRTDGVTEYSPAAFRSVVVRRFREWFADAIGEGRVTYAERRRCWDELREEVLIWADYGEAAARRAVEDFKFGDFRFTDFWEHSLKEYTFRFIWNLRAIVWGIARYDELKAAAAAAPALEASHG